MSHPRGRVNRSGSRRCIYRPKQRSHATRATDRKPTLGQFASPERVASERGYIHRVRHLLA
jgi:hypothetical protein